MSKKVNPKFHVWVPELFSNKGGIQVFSAFFVRGLQELYPTADYQIFLKNDRAIPSNTTYLPQTHFHSAGHWISWLKTPVFAIQLLIGGLWSRPDLIIATHLNFAIVAAWLNRFTGTPYWVVAHGVEAWNIKNSRVIQALHRADRILSVSKFTRDRLLQSHNFHPDRVTILPNTFDPERLRIAPKPSHLLEKYRLQPQQKIILTVSRLIDSEQYKGYQQVLLAMPQIRRTIPNVHYMIVGTGKDSDRILSLIHQLELQDCVTLTGFIPDAELCDYYNLCDVFAMPSKREGFGIVYLEALACGKPTLGGNQDGAVDALRQGELGALVDPDNLTEIAETLVDILEGNYANPLVYQAEALRHCVIDTYGFACFKQILDRYLQQQLK
ncbi:glycosyltransferase [Tumidithrix elongata RA019]|uniref:Glycosyltransferase n=1 Tax=Tumidithrix elongata BACA0141 TaxID=2716417 RepID=A0AAW9Q5B8_9CYAN|nr:glycosyltransferase [Tumidithrix elongata RA019]